MSKNKEIINGYYEINDIGFTFMVWIILKNRVMNDELTDISSRFYRYSEANVRYIQKALNTASDRKAKKLFKKIQHNSKVLAELSNRLLYYMRICEPTPHYAHKDYYAVLGISGGVSFEEIRRKFRKLALKYHPDRNSGDKEAEKKFKEIAEAWEVLGDTEKKSRYDSARSHPVSSPMRSILMARNRSTAPPKVGKNLSPPD